ncbi:MAG: SRPBCC domain-containing protein [Pseudolabrys sp.]
MSNPSFVYVTYIRATPDKVWEALTKADLTEKYWFGYRVSAEGKPGDYMTAVSPSGMQAHHDPILESDPPRRLVYS